MKTLNLTARFAAVVAMLFGALVAVTTVAAPAQAADEKYGYAKVTEYQAYLRYHINGGIEEILHVPEERATDEGFWFASKGGIDRSITWVYQPWGMWCLGAAQKVEVNPWLNTHKCGVDWDKAETLAPGTKAATEKCRQTTGQPWKMGRANMPTYCDDYFFNNRSIEVMQPGSSDHFCAPWEDQSNGSNGRPKCLTQKYSWENGPSNAFWTPAPDACTNLPADWNKRRDGATANASLYLPKGPVPTCDGSALPPNCEPNSKHQACTGTPNEYEPTPEEPVDPTPTPETFYATQTETVTATATQQAGGSFRATSTRVVHKVTRKAQRKFKGKVYRGKHTVKLKRTRMANVRMTATASATRTGTATASCSADTLRAAQECARDKARVEAQKTAHDEAAGAARAEAERLATQAAKTAAQRQAKQAVAKVQATKAQKKKAAKNAKKRAVKKAVAKVNKAKRARR